ncbi:MULTISPECIES: nSTAND1 domain-containing NTPase [Methylomonas]|uniref:nSTAND1 domain-containing NTPase n=1 Tax=Methylomonas TaxID=416 RepID=UPI001232DDB9|nr:ATP-binding protein [Methylomonas rhizoryzae]
MNAVSESTDDLTAATGLHLTPQNPWPGLATYDESSHDYFYGREAEVEELLRLIKLSPLTVLYGKSGLGKSSLLQAGLFPVLRQAHFLPVYIRLDVASGGQVPFSEQVGYWLRQALSDAGVDYLPFAYQDDLWTYLHRRDMEIWSPDNHLLTPVLVFDQFEEVFAGVHPQLPAPRVLCQGLADLIENKLPAHLASGQVDKALTEQLDTRSQRYRVLLSFREDFLPALKNWEQDVPSLLKNWCQLLPMSRACAIEALIRSGADILADGAAEGIVDFVGNLDARQSGGEITIEPVLLSLCCYQLNLKRQAAKAEWIDKELLSRVGQTILEDYYRNALSGMGQAAEFIEHKLIQGNQYRSSYPVQLALDENLITRKQLSELTDKHRLLRVEQQMGTPRVELIHDRLVSVVRRVRDKRQAEWAVRRVLAGAVCLLVLVIGLGYWNMLQDQEQADQYATLYYESKSRHADSDTGEEPADNPSPSEQAPADDGSATTTAPKSTKPVAKQLIYIQIRSPKQKPDANRLRAWFKQQDYRVPMIQLLSKGPSTTEVRYFRSNDATAADVLAKLLLQQRVANVSTKYISGFENSTVIPPGQFEIWFAPDAFSTTPQ